MFTSLTVIVHHVRPSECVSNAIKDRLHTDDSAKTCQNRRVAANYVFFSSASVDL